MDTYPLIVSTLAFLLFFVFVTFVMREGVHGSLSNARIGERYNFLYLQPLTGEYVRYCVKVLKTRKLNKEELDSLNCFSLYRRWDADFYRTATLVTCEMEDGSIRNFYGERATYCKRLVIPFLYKFWKPVVSTCPVRV